MNKNKPIGVFDSGIGGLSVLKTLVAELPDEDYIYFGDTARVPYGEKSKEQLLGFVVEILSWFKANNAKAVLMACNTSSAVVLDIVRNKYDFPIFGLIKPTANYVSGLDAKKIGIIATSATVNSKAYSKAITDLDPEKEVFETACPGLVEIVESGQTNSRHASMLVSRYINPLLEKKVDKIILGCTHYPYLADIINQITGRTDMLIDPAYYLVQSVKDELEEQNLINDVGYGSRKYFVSANAGRFVRVGKLFFSDCREAQQINLNQYLNLLAL